MSEGPLTELVALGAQNSDLISDNPKTSLFQEKINKITNFSKSSFVIHHKGKAGWGNNVRINIERKGDLLSTCYFVLELPEISVKDIVTNDDNIKDELNSTYRVSWSDILGYAAIEKASLYIGGQLIDEMSGEFMQLITDMRDDWNRFYMLGFDGRMNKPSRIIERQLIYIPLKFWFMQDLNKALPLIALQHHDVEIEIKLRDFDKLTNVLKVVKDENGTTMVIHSDMKLRKKEILNSHFDCTYIFLSPKERQHLAQKDHKILITQSQERIYDIKNNQLELDFNHIVKEIFFFVQPKTNIDEGEIFNFSGKLKYPPAKFEKNKYFDTSNEGKYFYENVEGELVEVVKVNENKIKLSKDLWDDIPSFHFLHKARILLNGHERIQWKDLKYFYYVQPYENFKNPNEQFYYTYSFSANSRSLGNFGGCNFSRIDNSQLQLEFNKPRKYKVSRKSDSSVELGNEKEGFLRVIAQNFNFLLISGGMGGLKFSN